jgi:hypothetical protein
MTLGTVPTTTTTTIAHGIMVVAGRMFARGTRITTTRGNVESITTGSVTFNIGICLKLNLLQGYDTSQAYDETTYDASYGQGEHSQDYLNDDRSQQRGFNKKRLVPSEPSPHVIFLGLDADFTEADVCRLPSVTLYKCAHH